MIKNTDNRFTFKNYIKYLKKYWVLVVIFAIIGIIGSLLFVSNNKVTYSANIKIMIYNAEADQGSAVSPYLQFKEILTSNILMEDKVGIEDASGRLEVKESNRGVFTITDTESNPEKAVDNIKKIGDNIQALINGTYSDAYKYEITVLQLDQQATPSTSTKKNILMCAMATFSMIILAAIIIFIKFDFSTEK